MYVYLKKKFTKFAANNLNKTIDNEVCTASASIREIVTAQVKYVLES